ncbi:chromosomal replication initiator protein DnaA [Candidatus Shapirobacteria bacterium CG10_big_fil_rev_8_21_14_0_10_48_15]|uniref:Chromosomal replication initiator protein DnaA n=1 Tax=Candidatus Shapirobacteria bacterium CG10_big_fil_rev_8_21_14_0_10_48_15 TaxID=1974484 RepID=A0A2M8L7G6_9BACT|nr:MAG: chromosomal replication initiator protein DnaA [Candidatus Shapirobacteria bacterium CG10_big_fil_rev_8_21_14_0_10_48_15]
MDELKVWKTVLENLKLNLSTANFSTWFPQTFINAVKAVDQKRQIVEIACPNAFARNTVENRYYSLIKDALDQITEKKCDLVFIVKGGKKIISNQSDDDQDGLFEKTKVPPAKSDSFQQILKRAGLRADFNFDNFAVSSTNQMAHAAAMAVSKSAGQAYNPLFLYGGVGVGKTHLMQAVAQEILLKTPQIKVIYCTSEDFTNEIVNAIRSKATDQFKNKYRSARLLLVDDIQFIAGKDRAQEEFFHTFNSISRVGGQVILTSDRRPDEIDKLEDRLRSRFEGGLAIDIQSPDFELRTAILLIKAQQKKIKLPMDVAQLVAGNITSTRKLEGMLFRLIAEMKTTGQPITPEMASAILGQNSETNNVPRRVVRPKEVLSAVANHYDLKIADLTGPRRPKTIAEARQISMYLLKSDLNLPYVEIGRFLGNRDHTTIMYGVGKITHNLSTSEELRVDIAGIKQKLYG